MKFHEWLDAEKGRTTAVAEFFGVTLSAVTQWREGVPRERMRGLLEFTGGRVGYEDMLPKRGPALAPRQVQVQAQAQAQKAGA
jgi:hypothetical protein